MVKTHHLLLLNIMSRGITLTEEQGEKLVKALGQRMLDKQKARTERDPYER